MSRFLADARAGHPLTGLEIIDMHGHLGRIGFTLPDLATGTLVREMDRIGVQSILVSHMFCMHRDTAWGNREILKAMREFPGRILGYLALWPISAEETRKETAWCLDQGFTGIKLHNSNGFPYTHPDYAPAFEMADARRLPMLFHTWGGPEEMAQMRELSQRYPGAHLLMAHAGTANEDEYIKIARECPNVYLELAFSRAPRGLVERLVNGAGADKVIWGSDAYFYSMTAQIGKVIGAKISEDALRQVVSGNAKRILGR